SVIVVASTPRARREGWWPVWGRPGAVPLLRLARHGRITAAADVSARDASQNPECLAPARAGFAVAFNDDADIFGADGMTRVALGQRTQHLDDARLPVRNGLPSDGVADDDVAEVGGIQAVSSAFQKHAAHLLYHAVEVVRRGQPAMLSQARPELVWRHLPV